jgi:predicted DCC family thiol-disulfide oxidoreductase YuxK
MLTGQETGDIWFAYDGECPICTYAVYALRIRESVGQLQLVDARINKDHPLSHRIAQERLNLDEGMVIQFGGQLYHGADALHVMALLGSSHGWFNRVNALLFRSAMLTQLAYPLMRGGRNLLIRLLGVAPTDNLKAR